MLIVSFADSATQKLLEDRPVKDVSSAIAVRARLKLVALHAAERLSELASPGADLKKLKGEKHGWQMRVNKQFRIRFNVEAENPLQVADVQFGDFH